MDWNSPAHRFRFEDYRGMVKIDTLKIFPPLVDFGVIALIGLRTLKTECFNPIDLNLSLGALIFSLVVEIYMLRKNKLGV